jgi:hypothetical protein
VGFVVVDLVWILAALTWSPASRAASRSRKSWFSSRASAWRRKV